MCFNKVEEPFGVNFGRGRAVIGGTIDDRLQPSRQLLTEAVLSENVDDAEVLSKDKTFL